jgi:GTP-binding protein
MRREGYEMTVSQPHVIFRKIDHRKCEPIEVLSVDTTADSAGKIIELVGLRKGEMMHMEQRGERQLLEFYIATRGMIGLKTRMITASAGEAVISHRFAKYDAYRGEIPQRINGVLVSMGQGAAVAYAIDGLQQRGTFFVEPGEMTYEGMIVGENCKDNDLVVNLQKGKQLTNVRAAGSDRNMSIAPPRRMSLEEALEFIDDDELVEVTPAAMRLRKRFLKEYERKRNRKTILQEV